MTVAGTHSSGDHPPRADTQFASVAAAVKDRKKDYEAAPRITVLRHLRPAAGAAD